MDKIVEYVSPELLALVPALMILGKIIKDGERMDNRRIPETIGIVAVLAALTWVLATSNLNGWQSVLLAIFAAFVQGLLCAGLSVYFHQLYKQRNDKDE